MRYTCHAMWLLLAPALLGAQDVVPTDWTYRLDGSQLEGGTLRSVMRRAS